MDNGDDELTIALSVDMTLVDHAGELAMLKTIDSLFQAFRFAPVLLLWLALPVAKAQQHRHDFRGAQFSGGQNFGTGNVRVSGGGTFGPAGTAQQLGAQSPSVQVRDPHGLTAMAQEELVEGLPVSGTTARIFQRRDSTRSM